MRASCAVIGTLLLLTSCKEYLPESLDPARHDHVDDDLSLSRDDYRHIARPTPEQAKNGKVADKNSGPKIPDVAQIIAAPRPPKIGETQLVSIAVTDDVPLKDVLIELARLADVDIELDAGITGGISFRAKDKPFNEVIERISNMAGLRYSMKNSVLRVERDAPYIQSYPIDFLNMTRESSGSISINTNVLSGGGGSSGGGSGSSGGGGGGLTTGSSSSITTSSGADFWQSFEGGISQILAYNPQPLLSELSQTEAPAPASTSAPTSSGNSTRSGSSPTTASSSPSRSASGSSAASGSPSGSSASASSASSSGAATAARPAAPAAAPTASTVNPASGGTPFYIMNKQAGILTVSATERQHELIKAFIEKVKKNATAQVLLEAKVVEVTLSDKFQSGIDWSAVKNKVQFDGAFAGTASTVFTISQTDPFGIGLDLQGAVKLAETFGTTRTLSSPRLHAMNNQQAVLTFAENRVFFNLDVQKEDNTSTTGTSNSNITVKSEVKTVPIGIIMTLQPSINLATNEVTLNVRPTLSRVVDEVNDPAVAFLIATTPSLSSSKVDLSNRIPVVEVRELDSILKLKNGQVMVMGGLMEQAGSNTEAGLPWVSEIPFAGNLFKSRSKDNHSKELIIFIRATIVNPNGSADDTDKTIYKKFSDDPRPLTF